MPHPIDALISDCDGVLVDSEVIAERVMYEALSAYAPLEELQRLLEGTFGLTSRDILDRVEKHFGLRIPDSFNREVRQRSEEMVAQVQPIPGAREALLALDLPVAVASNSRRHSLERSLARAGLSELIGERLASADMVALPKPAPDVYLHAASLLGVAPRALPGGGRQQHRHPRRPRRGDAGDRLRRRRAHSRRARPGTARAGRHRHRRAHARTAGDRGAPAPREPSDAGNAVTGRQRLFQVRYTRRSNSSW